MRAAVAGCLFRHGREPDRAFAHPILVSTNPLGEKRTEVRSTAFRVGGIVLVAAAVLLLAGVSAVVLIRYTTGAAVTVRGQEVELSARLQPDPPRPENQRLLVTVRRNGAPVREGALAVGYLVTANGTLPEVSGRARVEKGVEPGTYVAIFPRLLEGTWKLFLEFTSPQGSLETKFIMTIGRAGLTPVTP